MCACVRACSVVFLAPHVNIRKNGLLIAVVNASSVSSSDTDLKLTVEAKYVHGVFCFIFFALRADPK